MTRRLITIPALALALLLTNGPAFAQGHPGHLSELVDHVTTMARNVARAMAHSHGNSAGGVHISSGDQTEKFSKTVPLGKTGTFEIDNVAGNIVISGGTGEQAQISAIKRGRTPESLKNATIEVVEGPNRVEVGVQYPRNGKDGASVDFTVTVPRGASVLVKSISGDAKVTDIDGELRVESVSGDVTVTGAGKLSLAKSTSGTVIVQSASAPDSLSVHSTSGNVSLKSVKARSLEVSSVSGDVTLSEVTSDRLTGHTISGTVSFAGPMARGGRYEATSHSGDVVITTDGQVGFEVTASTFSGDIKSDLPITMRVGGEGQSKPLRRQQMRGTFGDGSAVLMLKSFSGDIRIVKK
jgi:hypothetical protein